TRPRFVPQALRSPMTSNYRVQPRLFRLPRLMNKHHQRNGSDQEQQTNDSTSSSLRHRPPSYELRSYELSPYFSTFPLFHFSTFQLRISPMRVVVLLLVFLALESVVASQAPSVDRAANPGRLRQLIPGHYVYSTNNEGRLFNSGVVSTSEGVL